MSKQKIKKQTIKSLMKSSIYAKYKPNYINEEERFSIYDLGNIDVFTKLYKLFNEFRYDGKKPSTPLQHSILTTFNFDKEDSEILSTLNQLNINTVFEYIDFIGEDYCYNIINSDDICVTDYFENYKSLK